MLNYCYKLFVCAVTKYFIISFTSSQCDDCLNLLSIFKSAPLCGVCLFKRYDELESGVLIYLISCLPLSLCLRSLFDR